MLGCGAEKKDKTKLKYMTRFKARFNILTGEKVTILYKMKLPSYNKEGQKRQR